MKLSVIIPTLNEAECIRECLQPLQAMRVAGHEVIVVDGGSGDDTIKRARDLCNAVITCKQGRATQMNAGADSARGDILVFLHADTIMTFDPAGSFKGLSGQDVWGCFSVRLSGPGMIYRMYSYCINLRARLSGIITGDQALFISRNLFVQVGGYPLIPLMEDVAISKKLKAIRAPEFCSDEVITSSRRWQRHGLFRTMVKMWVLRSRYALGASPAVLAKDYD